MGAVTSSTLMRATGEVTHVDGLATSAEGEDTCITYHYAYGPDLLPAGSSPDRTMWRYRDLLPLGDGAILYPLPIGDTPLIAPPQLRRVVGLSGLWLKDETRSPTGSNKDRATALVLEHAMRNGIRTVSCASTGNVAVSLAVGAAAAGVEAVIFVPAGVAEAKLAVMLIAGATVIKVAEGYRAAFELSRRASATLGWHDRNTGVNPLTLEAKKTVAFEIWEQLGRRVPDAVVVPVGDGPTLNAVVKGFRELGACGAAQGLPRVIGVQAEGCQPLKRAWEEDRPIRPVEPSTIADGIAVGNPIAGAMVLRDVRETVGGFVTVSDESMIRAMHTMASTSGVVPEPAGAAALAGLQPALASGLIDRHETVVVLVTGSGYKTPANLRPTATAPTLHADLDAVRAYWDNHIGSRLR